MAEWTDNDFAAFKDGVCIGIATVLTGKGAEAANREFYIENAGCEIKILPRSEAVAALRDGMTSGRECAGCGKMIKGPAVISELGGYWHQSCFDVTEEQRKESAEESRESADLI